MIYENKNIHNGYMFPNAIIVDIDKGFEEQ